MLEGRRRLTVGDQYRRAWAGEEPPDLAGFLAAVPSPSADDLLEIVEIDRSERWRRGTGCWPSAT